MVVTGLLLVVMLCLNIAFLVDLSINHRALPRGGGDGEHVTGRVEGGRIGDGGEHALRQFLNLKVHSSKEKVTVHVREQQAYSAASDRRGIHIVVLNQANGNMMAARTFDTYIPNSDEAMVTFLNSISDGRVLCFAILDEGTFSLGDNARSALKALGSRIASTLSWRDMWVFVTIKGGEPVAEDVGKAVDVQSWGLPVELHVTLPLSHSLVDCDWPDTPENRRRKTFCSKYEGYGALCHCANPLPLTIKSPKLEVNNVANVPVSIIASNRPLYLFRMLRGLLAAHGANSSLVTVFVDGFFQEPVEVAGLFAIRAVQHEPKSQKNGRISQHYKASLTDTFDLYPDSKFAIILEEDLDVSLDFFSYFSQTVSLLEEDDSIYCISAWNDQGYEHSCQDPALLYRVETMPGLGWILKRKMYKEELEPNWPGPDKLWDWDMWMRLDVIRKNRECIIPDISRTYHFGSSGLNMNPYFQDHYFSKHPLNTNSDVQLRAVESMRKEEYELTIHSLFRQASVLDHSKDPCKENFIPNTVGMTYVMYISMESEKDFDHWMKLSTCFHLWDLDARGFHKGLWRFWLKGNHILVVGHPYSPYSSKYKPSGVSALKLAPPKR